MAFAFFDQLKLADQEYNLEKEVEKLGKDIMFIKDRIACFDKQKDQFFEKEGLDREAFISYVENVEKFTPKEQQEIRKAVQNFEDELERDYKQLLTSREKTESFQRARIHEVLCKG